MSARDDLNRYEQDWERHMRWRFPYDSLDTKSGAYIWNGGRSGTERNVRFDEMPRELRDRVAKRLETAIAALVAEEHALVLAELQARAVAEAQQTLAELTGGAPPKPVVYHEPQPVPVEAEA